MKKEKIPNIPDKKFFKYIQKKGFLTGSIVLGGYQTGVSDIDVILEYDSFIEKYERFFQYEESKTTEEKEFLKENPEYDDDHAVAYVMNEKGTRYNLLLFKDRDSIGAWKDTTRTIIEMKKKFPVIHKICENREGRVTLFKLIRTCEYYAKKEEKKRD